MTNHQVLKEYRENGEQIDMKETKLGKDKPQPKKPESKFVKDVKNNWETITFALSNAFYLTLGLSLMLIAGVAFWSVYQLDMYQPMELAVKFASVLVGLTAFYPLAKSLTRR